MAHWMREAHAEATLLGLGCPFDCCDPYAGEPLERLTHRVDTLDGPVYAESLAEAAQIAREAAARTGKACRVERVAADL